MATLNITEYDQKALDQFGKEIEAGAEPSVATQEVTYTTPHQLSVVFSNQTRFIRVVTDTRSRVAFGEAPVAGATSMILEANVPEYFGLRSGDALRLSVIIA